MNPIGCKALIDNNMIGTIIDVVKTRRNSYDGDRISSYREVDSFIIKDNYGVGLYDADEFDYKDGTYIHDKGRIRYRD